MTLKGNLLQYFNPNSEIAEIGYTRFFKTCSGVSLLAIRCLKIITWDQASHWGGEVVWRGKKTARSVSLADMFPM